MQPTAGFRPHAGLAGAQLSTRATLAAISDGLAAFREGAGPEMGIMLDINFNFKTEGYLEVARTLRALQSASGSRSTSYDPAGAAR